LTSTGTPAPSSTAPASGAATAVAVLAALGAAGSGLMAVAHLALDLPFLAAGFGLGIIAYAVLAYGAARRRAWAWPVGLVVNAVALAASALPWRGLERSGLPTLVSLVALALLVSRSARNALLYDR
jgi:hypothetical protein